MAAARRWAGAVAALAATSAVAGGLGLSYGLGLATRVEVGPASDPLYGFSTLRVTDDSGSRQYLRVNEHGDLVLRWGAVVDFSGGATSEAAGSRAGYLLVMVDGEPKLLQLYDLPGERRAK